MVSLFAFDNMEVVLNDFNLDTVDLCISFAPLDGPEVAV